MTGKLLFGLMLSLSLGLFETEASYDSNCYNESYYSSSLNDTNKNDALIKQRQDIKKNIDMYDNELKNLERGKQRNMSSPNNKQNTIQSNINNVKKKKETLEKQYNELKQKIENCSSSYRETKPSVSSSGMIAFWEKQKKYYQCLKEIEDNKRQYNEALARQYEAGEGILGDLGKAIAATYRAKQAESRLLKQKYESKEKRYAELIQQS